MLIVKLILQILAVGIAILVSVLDYVFHDKRTKHFKILRICLFVAAGLFLVASIITTVGDDKERKKEVAELKSELNRGLNRIQGVEIEFIISVPFEEDNHSDLSLYTKRILTSLEKSYKYLSSKERAYWNTTNITIPYISESPLFPDLSSERVAYSLLSTVGFSIEIFSNKNEALDFIKLAGHSQGQGDLVLSVSRSAGKINGGDVFLQVNQSSKEYSLFSPGAKAEKPKRNTGKILSIPDLASCTVVYYFYPNSEFSEFEKMHHVSVANYRKLRIFGLTFSDGQKMYLKPEEKINNFGETVYVMNFPETYEEIEKIINR